MKKKRGLVQEITMRRPRTAGSLSLDVQERSSLIRRFSGRGIVLTNSPGAASFPGFSYFRKLSGGVSRLAKRSSSQLIP